MSDLYINIVQTEHKRSWKYRNALHKLREYVAFVHGKRYARSWSAQKLIAYLDAYKKSLSKPSNVKSLDEAIQNDCSEEELQSIIHQKQLEIWTLIKTHVKPEFRHQWMQGENKTSVLQTAIEDLRKSCIDKMVCVRRPNIIHQPVYNYQLVKYKLKRFQYITIQGKTFFGDLYSANDHLVMFLRAIKPSDTLTLEGAKQTTSYNYVTTKRQKNDIKLNLQGNDIKQSYNLFPHLYIAEKQLLDRKERAFCTIIKERMDKDKSEDTVIQREIVKKNPVFIGEINNNALSLTSTMKSCVEDVPLTTFSSGTCLEGEKGVFYNRIVINGKYCRAPTPFMIRLNVDASSYTTGNLSDLKEQVTLYNFISN